MRRMLAAAAAAATMFATPGLVVAQDDEGSGPNNVVNVSHTEDNTVKSRRAVQVGSTGAERVTSSNLAIARSYECVGCESLAAAFQAVFITGDPEYFSPRNAAAATNADCDGCGAFAYAYQYVVDTDGPARLSEAGPEKVDDVRADVNRLLHSGLPYDELALQLREESQRFRAIIDSELRRRAPRSRTASRSPASARRPTDAVTPV